MNTALIIIAAILILTAFILRDDGEIELDEPDEAGEREPPERSRREREDYTEAAYEALERGDVEQARHWWGIAGRSAASFEELRREGRG